MTSSPLCTVFNPAPPATRKKPSPLEKVAWQLNKAYLWAITQGAEQLLDSDCLAASSDALQILSLDSTTATGLLYNATRHFNPYEHFGAWGAVSRARHESRNFTSSWNSRQYVLRDFTNVLVKHGLSDGAHDMVQREQFVTGGELDPSDMRCVGFHQVLLCASSCISWTRDLLTNRCEVIYRHPIHIIYSCIQSI